jgi:hypothetical protein
MVTWQKSEYVRGAADGTGSYGGIYYREGSCLSTDARPTPDDLENGSPIIELDTGKVYTYDRENRQWIELGEEG